MQVFSYWMLRQPFYANKKRPVPENAAATPAMFGRHF
jgi:hypothetical protein